MVMSSQEAVQKFYHEGEGRNAKILAFKSIFLRFF